MNRIKNLGWRVTMAGLGINLALGILYTWSIFKMTIKESIESGDGLFNWSLASLNDPYAVCCLVFAFAMIFAGRIQDKLSPRITAVIGGVLTGLGLILISFSTAWISWIIGFGILTGMGLGFGYASATPPAIKWFPPAKTGMIAGIVVAGFGLASVYIAPLAQYLIGLYGVPTTMLIFGISFLIVVVILAQFLVNPPKAAPATQPGTTTPVKTGDFLVGQVLRTYQFYVLWLMYAFNAGAGLMVIGKLAKVVSFQASYEAGFKLVALLAIGNAGGRILAGMLSDKLGRIRTLQLFTLFQAILMFLTPFVDSALVLVFFAICIGMNYGSNLSVFPSITKDFFGLKNFGVNYGLIFTAWGVGSLLALVSGIVYDRTGSFQLAFFLAGALLIVSIILSF